MALNLLSTLLGKQSPTDALLLALKSYEKDGMTTSSWRGAGISRDQKALNLKP